MLNIFLTSQNITLPGHRSNTQSVSVQFQVFFSVLKCSGESQEVLAGLMGFNKYLNVFCHIRFNICIKKITIMTASEATVFS